MSTDPTQPLRAPASPPEEPETETPQAAQPTVKAPAVKAPGPPAAPVPPSGLPGQSAPPWGQEGATQAVPKWQAPPPPPPGAPRTPKARQDPPAPPPARLEQQPPTSADPAPPTRREQHPQPTRFDQQPTQWDRPPQQPPTQRLPPPPPPQPQRQPPPPPQPQQPSGWTEPRPWVEPQDVRPGQQQPGQQWSPQPPAPGQWGQPPAGQPPRLRGRQRKRRVRRSVMALFTVIVLLILLVIADRVALAVTENEFAAQIQQQGLPVKPNVTIQGFPFLTQLAAKDFKEVDISASNVPVQLPSGAGTIQITSINATIKGMHISSFSSSASARVDQMNATVFVSFGALASAGGIGDLGGITVTPVNSNTVKIAANVGGIFSDTEEARITTNGQTVNVKVLPGNNSALGSVLGSFGSFSFSLPPGVPSSLRITDLTLNSQGLTVKAAAANATFSSGK
jgi:hypothetical protein